MGDTPDFSGYATKAGLVCSDGLTIAPGAFQHQDGARVPLMWQHKHNESENVLGYGVLEHRDDGVYVRAYFNDTEEGKRAKEFVRHGDINALSIFANRLKKRGKEVMHGIIREVSLVIAGANPGASIDYVSMTHSSDEDYDNADAVIYTGLTLEHADSNTETKEPTVADENKTVDDVINTMDADQKKVLYYLVDAAGNDSDDDDVDDVDEAEHSMSAEEFIAHIDSSIEEKFNTMTANVFEKNGVNEVQSGRTHLTHSQIQTIVEDGVKLGSFKDSLLSHADEYGITDIELLFPDAKSLTDKPELLARQVEWVRNVLNATKRTPFSKVKSLVADLTAEQARAKGYVKGNLKKEEVIRLLRRTTGPTTVYKKQKLDRDDILDITDFDVVAWLKWEIRFMLEEELARAILIGDGRSAADDDKIKDPEGQTDGTGIRSILHDNEMYAIHVELPANVEPKAQVEQVIRSRAQYRGTGNPTFYTTDSNLIGLLLQEDKMGRRLYATEQELAAALRVSKIETVEVMEEEENLLGIIVNLIDYNIGTNAGGDLSFFEDFDIDFNQNKYLMETRLSGALTKPKSAIVLLRSEGTAVVATAPSFDTATNTLTIPSVTGVEYFVDGAVITAGTVEITETTDVEARATDGYYLQPNTTKYWTFTYTNNEG